eukprot:TRINITY_DN1957_c0_g1_i1.p1 TRINITY_DN1957_c0_g1~~TRINITY_DN1957_c0_g1_i1.p1  ORF type:complete len:184 (+),score=22.67 TRINITY_DN1957_c0_g1_i1:198-749(+)
MDGNMLFNFTGSTVNVYLRAHVTASGLDCECFINSDFDVSWPSPHVLDFAAPEYPDCLTTSVGKCTLSGVDYCKDTGCWYLEQDYIGTNFSYSAFPNRSVLLKGASEQMLVPFQGSKLSECIGSSPSSSGGGPSTGAIIGLVVGGIALVVVIVAFVVWRHRRQNFLPLASDPKHDPLVERSSV